VARNKLTETRCRAIDKPGVYGDGDGLWLRVQRAGSKNWVFIYRRGSARNEIGLGGYGRGTAPVSLALAREKAESIRQQLARGDAPRAGAKTTTFGECVESLLAVKEAEWRNDKHAAQWRMTLRKYAKSLHPLPVDAVTVDDVVSCLEPHWSERPETADRLRARIGAVLDYAKARGLRTGDNPAAWRGNLQSLLPRRQRLTRGRHAALDYHAAPEAIARLRAAAGVSARAVEFLCLTAARSSEARFAAWSEIDLEKAIWTIPAERMKAGIEHRVPLSKRAIEILEARPRRTTGDLVFGGDRDGKPISDTAMTKALRRASPNATVTIHGLRSTFRDWAGDNTAHPRDVAEAALAHTIPRVEAAYRRRDALEKRRLLMTDWAAFCGSAPATQQR
jgi:integrase